MFVSETESTRELIRVLFVSMDVASPPSPVTRGKNDKVYVAVGEKVEDNKLLLLWALKNCGGRKICILHVHRPAKLIPVGKLSEIHLSLCASYV